MDWIGLFAARLSQTHTPRKIHFANHYTHAHTRSRTDRNLTDRRPKEIKVVRSSKIANKINNPEELGKEKIVTTD